MDLLWPLRRMRCMKRRSFLAAAAAPLVTAAFPRALTAATNGGGVVALVTADLESRVVAVDTSSGRIVKRIPTVRGPRSIEGNVFGQALVAHTSLGRVSILDTATLTVTGELGGLGEPRYTAMHPSERIAYVSDSKRESVVVVDLARRRIAGHVALPGPARHLSLSDDGRRLWVVLGSKAGRVAILDADNPLRPALRHTLVPPFLAHDVAWAPGGERVWLTSGARGKIAVYGRESATPLALLRADAPPQHVAFSRSRAYVTSGRRRHALCPPPRRKRGRPRHTRARRLLQRLAERPRHDVRAEARRHPVARRRHRLPLRRERGHPDHAARRAVGARRLHRRGGLTMPRIPSPLTPERGG